MLSDKNAVAVVAVKNMDAAKKFYEETLGLSSEKGDDMGGVYYKTGNSGVFVYESQFAGTNKATGVTWGVGNDLEKIMSDLRSKGVKFEQYDIPGLTREGDVHVMGELKSAWFKDPDGNILNLVNQM